MIVYKLLNKEYGLKALRNLRIKVATLSDLNDPFELFSVNLSGKEQRRGFRTLKDVLNENIGLLCFSKSYKNPLLWSHYADKHKGVALEIGVFDGYVQDVKYVKTRTKLNFKKILEMPEDQRKKAFLKIMTTKYYPWCYEDECRAILPKEDVKVIKNIPLVNMDTGKSFSINSMMLLTGIVLGPLCDITYKDIENSLPAGVTIDVTKTRLAFNSFNVVKNRLHKTKQVHGRA